jgi:prepilin-type N-terminal cleavage/methylation domain-containing protein
MNKSFTLIEILVVIVVIGIISSFIIVGLSSVSGKANIAKGQAFSNSLRNSLLMNLVSEWKFDGPTADNGNVTVDDIKDSWGNKNCSLSGIAPKVRTGTNCISGSCIYFDRENDGYLTCGNLGLYSSFTVNFWAKKINSDDYNCFLDGDNAWSNGFHFWANGNSIHSRLGYNGTSGINMSSSFDFNTSWNNITFIVDRNTNQNLQKLYINGNYINSISIVSIPENTRISFFIIGFSQGNSAPLNEFRGFIDEVRFYGEAMSFSKIRENYFIGINKLYRNKGIVLNEFNQRLTELKSNLAINE